MEQDDVAASRQASGNGSGVERPSDLLERAAVKLEELAEQATPGPWRFHDTWLPHGGHTATVMADAQPKSPLIAWLPTFEVEPWGMERRSWQNAMWMAAASPLIAAPLAAMLRFDAMRLRWAKACEDVDKSYRGFELARQILGNHTVFAAEGKERSDP
jgi:hypothetical protein